jgi:hypothetical protein
MAACPYPSPSCSARSGRQKFCRQEVRGDIACVVKKPLANISFPNATELGQCLFFEGGRETTEVRSPSQDLLLPFHEQMD